MRISRLELEEILNNTRGLGEKHSQLITLLIEEEEVYTRQGRLNKSALARMMDMKPKDLEELFNECRRKMIE